MNQSSSIWEPNTGSGAQNPWLNNVSNSSFEISTSLGQSNSSLVTLPGDTSESDIS